MTDETPLEYVLRKLRDNKGRVRHICRVTGTPYSTVNALRQGKVKKPYYSTIQKLEEFFRGEQ